MKAKDVDIGTEYISAHIGFAKYGDRAAKAQKWVEGEIVRKMMPVMPRKTGNLIGVIQSYNSVINGSGVVRAAQDYGTYLYTGLSKAGNPFNWTNPMTQARWGHYAFETNKAELERGVRDIFLGKEPNGTE